MKDFYGKTQQNNSFRKPESSGLIRVCQFVSELKNTMRAFYKRPLLLPAVLLFSCGILCFNMHSFIPSVLMSLTVLLGTAVLCLDRSFDLNMAFSECHKISRKGLAMSGAVLSAALVFTGLYIDSRLNVPDLPSGYGEYGCVVTGISYDLADNMDVTVRLDSGVYAKAGFYMEDPPEIMTGDALILYGKLREPEKAGNPGEFDYRKYLRTKGISYTFSCERCEVISRARGLPCISGKIQKAFFEMRRRAFNAVTSCFDLPGKTLTAAVCLGDKSLADDSVIRDFRMSCCSHLLAVSGMHFSAFLICLPLILGLLKADRKTAFAVHLFFAVLIGCITGWSESVTRAAIMSLCVLAMRDWLSALSLASVIMILADPFCPMSSGFQMSFCAVIAIKVYSDRISRVLRNLYAGELLSSLISPVLSAGLGMLPFWSDISMRPDIEHVLIQLSASFAAQASCAFFVPCVILCLIFPFWSQYLSAPLLLCLKILHKIVETGSLISSAGGAPVHLSKVFLFTLAGVVFLFMLPPCFLKRILVKPFVLLLAVSIGSEAVPLIVKPECIVVFADVGQGDCCLIMTPDKTCLIDGGTYKEGSTTVRDILDYYGICKADICVMSHWDSDHAGGIAALSEHGRTGKIFTSYIPDQGRSDKDVEEFFEAASISLSSKERFMESLESLSSGDRIFLSENVYFDVISPVTGSGGGNEYSLVMMLHIVSSEDTAILFTGDIGAETEKALIRSGSDLDCDILKVAHHGSKYSTTEGFLEYSSPEIAVISVGEHNFYGHPAPLILERLESFGCEVFRTDEEGAVIMKF